VWLDDAAAGRTVGHVDTALESSVQLVTRAGGPAVQAAGACGVAVQLDHRVGRQAGPLVEIVYVLRDAAVQPPEAIQLGQGAVGRVGSGRPDDRVRGAPQRPVAAPTLVTAGEILVGELARIEAGPEAAGATKVRDAGLGAHPGAGEYHGAAGLGEQLRQTAGVAHRDPVRIGPPRSRSAM
jgi:hypothetical protein